MRIRRQNVMHLGLRDNKLLRQLPKLKERLLAQHRVVIEVEIQKTFERYTFRINAGELNFCKHVVDELRFCVIVGRKLRSHDLFGYSRFNLLVGRFVQDAIPVWL